LFRSIIYPYMNDATDLDDGSGTRAPRPGDQAGGTLAAGQVGGDHSAQVAAPQLPDLVRVRPRVPPQLPPVDVPGQNGGRLYRGGVPRELRSGTHKNPRPTQLFNAKMRRLADSPALARSLRTILCDPDHEQFGRIAELVIERGYGRVPQKVEAEHNHRHAVVLLPPMDAPPPVLVVPPPSHQVAAQLAGPTVREPLASELDPTAPPDGAPCHPTQVAQVAQTASHQVARPDTADVQADAQADAQADVRPICVPSAQVAG
jgi:hypothetical protein